MFSQSDALKGLPPRALRERAEASIADDNAPALDGMTHEVAVCYAELEIQNDELRRIQERLDVSLRRAQALFDGAPIAFLAVTEDLSIVDYSDTASVTLKLPKARRPRHLCKKLSAFVADVDVIRFHHFWRAALRRDSGRRVS